MDKQTVIIALLALLIGTFVGATLNSKGCLFSDESTPKRSCSLKSEAPAEGEKKACCKPKKSEAVQEPVLSQ